MLPEHGKAVNGGSVRSQHWRIVVTIPAVTPLPVEWHSGQVSPIAPAKRGAAGVRLTSPVPLTVPRSRQRQAGAFVDLATRSPP